MAQWKKIYSDNISVFNQELSKTRFLWPAAATFAATPRRENSSWTSGRTWRSRLNRCPSPAATFSPAATTFTTTTWIAGTPTTSCQRMSSLMFSLYPVKRCQINIIDINWLTSAERNGALSFNISGGTRTICSLLCKKWSAKNILFFIRD